MCSENLTAIFQPTSVVFSWPCLTRKVQRQILPKIRQKRPKRSLQLLQQINNLLQHLSNGHWLHRNGKHQETLSSQKSRWSKKPPPDMSLTYPISEETGEILWITVPFYSKQQQRTLRPCSIAPIKDLYFLKVKKDMLLLSSLTLPTLKRKIKLSSITWLTLVLHNKVNIHFKIKPLQNLKQQISKC